MAAATLLTEVETAISACLLSQEYTSKGLAQKRARLAELQAFRQSLLVEIEGASTNSGSMATVGQIDYPT